MQVSDEKIRIHVFFKKHTILFEDIIRIIVFDDRLTLGIEYKNNNAIDYIKIRMFQRRALLSILETKTKNVEYR